jgi:hypothetical protein
MPHRPRYCGVRDDSHAPCTWHLQLVGISLRSATEPIDDTSTRKLMDSVLAVFCAIRIDERIVRTGRDYRMGQPRPNE